MKVNEEDLATLRVMRRLGTPLERLGQIYGADRSTILRWTDDIEPEKDGHKLTIVPISQLLEWLPAMPWEGLPLPMWLVRAARLDWKSIGERLAGLPTTKGESAELIKDISDHIRKPRRRRKEEKGDKND